MDKTPARLGSHVRRRRTLGLLVAPCLLVAGLVGGGAIASAAASTTSSTSRPATGIGRGHHPEEGDVFSGSGSGEVQQTTSGLPAAGWGSFFGVGLSLYAGPQAAVPQPEAVNVLPRSGSVGRLHVRNVTPAGQSPALVGPAQFTVFDNTQATAVTCTIPAGASDCAFSGRAVRFAEGDLISIQVKALTAQAVSLYRTSWSVTFT